MRIAASALLAACCLSTSVHAEMSVLHDGPIERFPAEKAAGKPAQSVAEHCQMNSNVSDDNWADATATMTLMQDATSSFVTVTLRDGRPDTLYTTNVTQEIRHRRVAALIAKPHDLPRQLLGRKAGKARDALPRITFMGLELARSWLAWPVNRRFKATVEILAHGLAVEPNLARDGGHAQTLSLQIMDHHDLPQFDHRAASSIAGAASGGIRLSLPRVGRHANPLWAPQYSQLGNFQSTQSDRHNLIGTIEEY